MANSLLATRVDDLLESIEHAYVDVGTVSTIIVRGSQSRRFLLVQNDGNKDVYIMFGRPAAIHQGLCLKANGATALFSQCNSSLCCQDLYAITNSTTPVRVLVAEGH